MPERRKRQMDNNQEEDVITIPVSNIPRRRRSFNPEDNKIIEEQPIKDGLTSKQRLFVKEYVRCWNGHEACKNAGYTGTDNSLYEMASQNLRKLKIKQAIEQYEKGLATRFISDKERILKEMSLLAYSDLKDYVTNNSDPETIAWFESLPPQTTRAIKKLKIKTFTKILARDGMEGKAGDKLIDKNIEFELYDKPGALIKMGQEIGMFKEVKQLEGKDGNPLFPSIPGAIIFDFGVEQE